MTRHEGLHDAEFSSDQERPKYSKHKASGRAYARCIYFGRFGTASSREAYNRVKAEWLQNGG